ncbi:hypothetical protein, partial [Staphylococcus aureus]
SDPAAVMQHAITAANTHTQTTKTREKVGRDKNQQPPKTTNLSKNSKKNERKRVKKKKRKKKRKEKKTKRERKKGEVKFEDEE